MADRSATRPAGTGSPAHEWHTAERLQVGLTMPRRTKDGVLQAAGVLGWPPGAWVMAAVAEHGLDLRTALGAMGLCARPRIEDAVFVALDLTPDERDECDAAAMSCGLNRSAFVTSVSRLALGEELDAVVAPLVEPG